MNSRPILDFQTREANLEMFHYVLPTALCNIRLPSFRMQPLVLGALSVFIEHCSYSERKNPRPIVWSSSKGDFTEVPCIQWIQCISLQEQIKLDSVLLDFWEYIWSICIEGLSPCLSKNREEPLNLPIIHSVLSATLCNMWRLPSLEPSF